MKGELRLTILKAITEGVIEISELFETFLLAGYGASYSKLKKTKYELHKHKNLHDLETKRKESIRYYQLIFHLKKDGLIQKNILENNIIFSLTRKGIKALAQLKKRKTLSLPSSHYTSQKSDHIVIVSFDIPEQERKKRDWLRSALKNLNLSMVQKSLWMGKIELPRSFLDDITRLRLASHVEIFEVTKKGSLAHIV